MTCDESYELLFAFFVDCDEGYAGCESVLRRMDSAEVARDAIVPVRFGLPALCANGCHCWDVSGLGRSDDDWHVGTSALRWCLRE